jgi:hypothetical protein
MASLLSLWLTTMDSLVTPSIEEAVLLVTLQVDSRVSQRLRQEHGYKNPQGRAIWEPLMN